MGLGVISSARLILTPIRSPVRWLPDEASTRSAVIFEWLRGTSTDQDTPEIGVEEHAVVPLARRNCKGRAIRFPSPPWALCPG